MSALLAAVASGRMTPCEAGEVAEVHHQISRLYDERN